MGGEGCREIGSCPWDALLPALCSHKPKFEIRRWSNVLNCFFFPFRFGLFFRGPANDNRAEGRSAPPIPERLQHLFPKQTHSGARTERRGPLAHTHSPARSPGCPVQGPRQRLLWARVVMALQPLPVPSVGRRMQSQASLSLCPLGWKKQV